MYSWQQHAQAPAQLILDLDATDDPLHGNQEGRFFHGYYGHYCYLPLYIFCGEFLLGARLRPYILSRSWPDRLFKYFTCCNINLRNSEIIARKDCDGKRYAYMFCFASDFLDTELSVFMQQLRAQGAAGAPGLA
jgi:hypothetical protein